MAKTGKGINKLAFELVEKAIESGAIKLNGVTNSVRAESAGEADAKYLVRLITDLSTAFDAMVD